MARCVARPRADLDHVAAADRALVDAMAGEDGIALAIIDAFAGWGWRGCLERGTDRGQLGGAAGIGQETEVANPAEPFRQHVEEKAPDELVRIKRHHLGFVVGAIILPAESDTAILAGKEPAVGDGNAMGIAAQIFQDLLRPCEGRLA